MRWAVALVAVAGCYSPSYDNCQVSCVQSGKCPSGLECVGGVCVSPGGVCGGSGSMDAVDVTGWAFRKQIVINPVSSVTDFPVLLNHVDAELANFAQTDGGDIRFTTATGGALPHEIERFVKATGELVTWVKIPNLVERQPLTIFMYYGNDQAVDQQSPAAVWDTSYLGVWHLADKPGDVIADSTSVMRDGVKGMTNTPAATDVALIGSAQKFTGTSTDYVTLMNDNDLDRLELTFEAWVNTVMSAQPNQRPLFSTPPEFNHSVGVTYIDPGTTDGARFVINAAGTGTTQTLATEIGSLHPGMWQHLMVVFNGPTIGQVYIDGVLQSLSPPPTFGPVPAVPGVPVTIGVMPGSNMIGPYATLDEVRLSSSSRSADYARQVTAQAASPSSIVTFGLAEAAR